MAQESNTLWYLALGLGAYYLYNQNQAQKASDNNMKQAVEGLKNEVKAVTAVRPMQRMMMMSRDLTAMPDRSNYSSDAEYERAFFEWSQFIAKEGAAKDVTPKQPVLPPPLRTNQEAEMPIDQVKPPKRDGGCSSNSGCSCKVDQSKLQASLPSCGQGNGATGSCYVSGPSFIKPVMFKGAFSATGRSWKGSSNG